MAIKWIIWQLVVIFQLGTSSVWGVEINAFQDTFWTGRYPLNNNLCVQ